MLTLTAMFGKTAVWGHYTANPREMKAHAYITVFNGIHDLPPYTIIFRKICTQNVFNFVHENVTIYFQMIN